MKIHWGFLTTATALLMATAVSDLRGQVGAGAANDETFQAHSQVPLAAAPTLGWSSPASLGTAEPGYSPATAAFGMNYPGGPVMPAGPAGAAPYGGGYLPAAYEAQAAPGPFPLTPVAMDSYGPAMYAGGSIDAGDGWDGGYGCEHCGGMGCPACSQGGHGVAGGMVARLFHALLPYTEGGYCAPRWYDITADALYLTREDAGRSVVFATDGVGGPAALSTDNLDFSEELGLRLTGAVQIFAGTNLEFTYLGLIHWASAATAERDDFGGFFSVYSDFGVSPPGGFDETDRSAFQQINYSTTLDSFELNFRRRWQSANCLVQGSWLAGVRYVYLTDDLDYSTTGGDDFSTPGVIEVNGRSSTDLTTRNSLTGFQLGGDLWTTITPGISVGGEIKAGVFGNYANARTVVVASTTAPSFSSTFEDEVDANDVALVGEGRLEFIYRTGPNWTLRVGYSLLFLDGIVLSPENLNPTAPNIQGAARQPFKNDNGSAFFHGAFAGLEWMW